MHLLSQCAVYLNIVFICFNLLEKKEVKMKNIIYYEIYKNGKWWDSTGQQYCTVCDKQCNLNIYPLCTLLPHGRRKQTKERSENIPLLKNSRISSCFVAAANNKIFHQRVLYCTLYSWILVLYVTLSYFPALNGS